MVSSQCLKAMFCFYIPEFHKCVFRGADHTILAIYEEDTCYNTFVATEPCYACFGDNIPQYHLCVLKKSYSWLLVLVIITLCIQVKKTHHLLNCNLCVKRQPEKNHREQITQATQYCLPYNFSTICFLYCNLFVVYNKKERKKE